MKKTFIAIILVTLVCTMFAGVPVYADALTRAEKNAALIANERTDEYALDYHKHKEIFSNPKYADIIKTAQDITAGITDDYEKVRAIFKWVRQNINYDYAAAARNTYPKYYSAVDVLVGKITTCGGFANLTVVLAQAAGFPAKWIDGTYDDEPHAWAEVWVDNRWVLVDSATDLFDASYSVSYEINANSFEKLDAEAWDGTLTFFDITNNRVLKEIKNFPCNGLLTETYGFDINDLFLDTRHKKPVTLNTVRIDSLNNIVFVKRHRDCSVGYYTQLDNQYHSMISYPIRTEGTTVYCGETVLYGSKITEPTPPVKDGYTFIGWYDGSITDPDAKKWDYENDILTETNLQLFARFQKNTEPSVTPKPTPKPTVKPTPKPTPIPTPKPTPVPVTTVKAVPTTSTVYVNGKQMTFEAYGINGNNYFKLRDLAKAVNGTNKNFEVTWDGTKKSINLVSNSKYTVVGGELGKGDGKTKTATANTSPIYRDGSKVVLSAYTIGGNNYFKLRDVAQAFNIGVTWDGKTSTIGINTAIDYVP